MRVKPVKRVKFDLWEPPVSLAAHRPSAEANPFSDELAAAVLEQQAKSMNLSEDDAEYFVYAGKEWAREHLGLFAPHN